MIIMLLIFDVLDPKFQSNIINPILIVFLPDSMLQGVCYGYCLSQLKRLKAQDQNFIKHFIKFYSLDQKLVFSLSFPFTSQTEVQKDEKRRLFLLFSPVIM